MKRFHDEHIVPLALNGALILSEASCQQCERIINREIENCLLTGVVARIGCQVLTQAFATTTDMLNAA